MTPTAATATRPGARRATLLVVAALVAAAAVVLAAGVARPDGAARRTRPHPAAAAAGRCSRLFVPAFFWPTPGWSTMLDGAHRPSVVILDLTTTGAGASPNPTFQSAVRLALHKGVTVLGYSSTQYGSRPLAEVKADVANYKAWYGVTGVFLDEVSSQPSELAYYRSISSYVRGEDPTATIWLNTGDYPPRSYMALGNVVMAYESPYSSYRSIQVPRWARDYSPLRFAHNVYDTPAAKWRAVLRLAHERGAGWTYVTDGTGGNPYGQLPSYWKAESAADAGCRA